MHPPQGFHELYYELHLKLLQKRQNLTVSNFNICTVPEQASEDFLMSLEGAAVVFLRVRRFQWTKNKGRPSGRLQSFRPVRRTPTGVWTRKATRNKPRRPAANRAPWPGLKANRYRAGTDFDREPVLTRVHRLVQGTLGGRVQRTL